MARQEQLSGYDQRMFALMNRREGVPLYRTAGRRRAVVGVHVVLTAAFVAAWLGTVVGELAWTGWAMLGLLLPWCVATGAINGATRGLLELRPRALDERQRAERDRVRAKAHQIMGWVLLAAVLVTGIAGFSGLAAKALVFQVAVCALVLHWLLPLWVAGLAARDEPDADE
ncbi:hypothetical protein [Streptomyces flavofungini]|uniref:Uncharacterized protein n=1 Tax=Streptomyces flavofungini TaxID=68200 RepID=A0ABS0X5H7_9ACTN|nr:hypothetical protein [Streptomyces flavofungini]MBJ3808447.1 hypothetical protein [Streptomyces flavofungini]GHC69627.1 hypothetical protein GCM10010349_44580 [Streptomyces flavofungini]